ncbi:UNVERIFIED_CONTAM: hypothetical protein Sradi_6645500 [Sesamum radiatum]|uniref:Uncharacterized protein n=1 Tax=Sesamum radiatum TaxID=300843 RepID=A0AAW2JNC1_SESRA
MCLAASTCAPQVEQLVSMPVLPRPKFSNVGNAPIHNRHINILTRGPVLELQIVSHNAPRSYKDEPDDDATDLALMTFACLYALRIVNRPILWNRHLHHPSSPSPSIH